MHTPQARLGVLAVRLAAGPPIRSVDVGGGLARLSAERPDEAYCRLPRTLREAARVCCSGRRASHMLWNSPSVVSNVFRIEGSAASFCGSRLPRPWRCTMNRTAMTQRVMSAATSMRELRGRWLAKPSIAALLICSATSMTARARALDFMTRDPACHTPHAVRT